jgi:plasmid stability protein
MARQHAHDDYVEVELTRGTAKIQAAVKGLDAKRQKQVMQAVEVSVNEAIDQTLDWANDHFEEYDAELSAAASGVLVAMAKAQDDPPVLGRVLAGFLIIGLQPDIAGALKARRAEHGAAAEAELADYLARVRKTFTGKGEGSSGKAARKSGAKASPRRKATKAAKR